MGRADHPPPDARGAVTGYTGGVGFTSTDGQASLPANYTFVAGDTGTRTFSNAVTLRTAGSQTVIATDTVTSSITGTSGTITVGPAAASKLVMAQQPTNTVAANAISPAVTAQVQDSFGNVVTSSGASISMAIGTNPSGGTLSGTTPVSAVNGVATFNNLSINKVATGYTLSASSAGLTTAASGTFNITPGVATKLAFTTQPTTAVAGVSISPAVQVTVQDASGNTVNSSSATISMAIGTNPSSGALGGTITTTATNGVATFGSLSINKVGTGYTLIGSSTGLTSATSTSFNITPGAATGLAFTIQPTTAAAGASITPAALVTVQDALGNTVTSSTASIMMAIGTNPSSGTLSGTTPVSAVNGVATFNNLSINRTGTGYTLSASSTGLTAAISTSFNITPGSASKLAFTTQPSSVAAGTSISPAVQVTVQDASGNTVTSSSATISMAIGTNPSSGTLSGSTPVSAVNGVATFNNLSINKTGTGYTLSTSSTGLTTAASGTFNITPGAASKLVFTTQPSKTKAGNTIPAIIVGVEDTLGNLVTSSTASITITIAANPGGGTLSGTTPVSALNGVATFNNLSIDKTGNGYTVSAASSGLTSDTSIGFQIN